MAGLHTYTDCLAAIQCEPPIVISVSLGHAQNAQEQRH